MLHGFVLNNSVFQVFFDEQTEKNWKCKKVKSIQLVTASHCPIGWIEDDAIYPGNV